MPVVATANGASRLAGEPGMVRRWTGTVSGPWGVPVRYDCQAESAQQARVVIAEQAQTTPVEVRDVARTCGIFSPVEAGDPR